jgi:hypothetical protein
MKYCHCVVIKMWCNYANLRMMLLARSLPLLLMMMTSFPLLMSLCLTHFLSPLSLIRCCRWKISHSYHHKLFLITHSFIHLIHVFLSRLPFSLVHATSERSLIRRKEEGSVKFMRKKSYQENSNQKNEDEEAKVIFMVNFNVSLCFTRSLTCSLTQFHACKSERVLKQ